MLRSIVAPLLRAMLLAGLLASPLAHAQKRFTTPESAAEALVKAIRDSDTKALPVVLGKEWKRIIPTGDLSRYDVDAFLAAWDKHHRVVKGSDDTALLSVGDEPGFTLPIPIVRSKSGSWNFDVVSGTAPLRIAPIGRNE